MLTHRGAIHNYLHFRRKLVRNQRKNFINFRVRKEFVPTIHVHADAGSGMTVLFALSMYLEPYVFVFPLHVVAGPPPRWGAMDPALLHRTRALSPLSFHNLVFCCVSSLFKSESEPAF